MELLLFYVFQESSQVLTFLYFGFYTLAGFDESIRGNVYVSSGTLLNFYNIISCSGKNNRLFFFSELQILVPRKKTLTGNQT